MSHHLPGADSLKTSVTKLEQSDATPSAAVVADPQNEELRRLAALAFGFTLLEMAPPLIDLLLV